MKDSIRRWVVGAFLLGALAFAGAQSAQAQYRRDPDDRRDTSDRRGTFDRRDERWGGGYRDYQREIRTLENRIRREKEELRADTRRFGKNSFQARAAKERLKRDERALKQLKKEMKHDRRYAQRGNERDRWRR